MLLFVAVSIFESGLVAKKLLISSMVRSREAPRYNWHECGGLLIVISLMLACSWSTNFVQEVFCCWCRSFVGAGLLLLCQLYLCRDACVLPKQRQTVPHLFLFCRGGWSSNCGVHRNFCLYGFLSTSAPFASVCKALKLESSSLTMLVQGPLAWALIVWRCSLVFSSIDKIVSVLIHLLPGDQAALLNCVEFQQKCMWHPFVLKRWLNYVLHHCRNCFLHHSVVGSKHFLPPFTWGHWTLASMALIGKWSLSLVMAVRCTTFCLQFMANALLSCCECVTAAAIAEGSWSNDLIQVCFGSLNPPNAYSKSSQ